MLPPGVSSQNFSRALQAFEKSVGQDGLFTSEEDLAAYNDAYDPFAVEPARQLRAAAAVAPVNVEQVQAVVRTANKYRIPIYPISTGRNLGYGGSSPTASGSVIVDLKRMNRVLEVNEREAYVVVEPGVNFLELYRYMEEHHHPFMVATPEPGWGSPIGNALEHGVSYVVGDNLSAARGLEVVLPSGEILRTGMGALPDGRLWHTFPYGFGPHVAGLFAQSNFGIVTRMGFALVRKPEMQTSFSVTSAKSDDLYALVEIVQSMRETGLLYLSSANSPIRSPMGQPGQPVDSHLSRTKGLSRAKELLRRKDGGSAAEWDQLGREMGVPVSVVTGNVRGPAKVVEATLEYAKERFAVVPGASFAQGEIYRFPLQVDAIPPNERPQFGIPSLWPFSSLVFGDISRGMYFFSPVCRATAEDLFAIKQTISEVVLEHADESLKDLFLGWIYCNTVYPKAFVFTYPFPIGNDAILNQKNRELFQRLIAACAAKGWGEYRAHAAFQSDAMAQYSYNGHALLRFCETLKDAIDPNGILAPGKSGIWPREIRRARPPVRS
jgi:(+)-pinoresinol hydroxylase